MGPTIDDDTEHQQYLSNKQNLRAQNPVNELTI